MSCREKLVKSLAYIEADIDFSDEELPDSLSQKMMPILTDIHTAITKHLNDNNRGERLRDGIQVAIIGAPNAGKSTLVNCPKFSILPYFVTFSAPSFSDN